MNTSLKNTCTIAMLNSTEGKLKVEGDPNRGNRKNLLIAELLWQVMAIT